MNKLVYWNAIILELEAILEIRGIESSDIHENMLNCFNRYQLVTQCWRKEESIRILEKVSYSRDWDENKKKVAINNFALCIEQGGKIIGALNERSLIGFAKIEGRLFGSFNQYVNLSLLLVSNEYRHKGIGSMLFASICDVAASLGAKKIYISAHSAVEAISFYEKMGCADAEEIFTDLFDEPCDWPLEYELRRHL